MGCSSWSPRESDTTERLNFHFHFQMVKHLPTMRKTRVQSMGWEDLLEKGMAIHSSILAHCPKKGLKEIWASLVAQMVKRLPGMRETWVRSLGWEDPLKKEMATHSSTLAWKIPWTEEPGRLQSMGSQRVGHD